MKQLGLLNIRSLSSEVLIDVLCLTEAWLKPNDYITLNESTPNITVVSMNPV